MSTEANKEILCPGCGKKTAASRARCSRCGADLRNVVSEYSVTTEEQTAEPEQNGSSPSQGGSSKGSEGKQSRGYVVGRSEEPEPSPDAQGKSDGRKGGHKASSDGGSGKGGGAPKPKADRVGEVPIPERPQTPSGAEETQVRPDDTPEIAAARLELDQARTKTYRVLTRAAESLGKLEGLLPAAKAAVESEEAKRKAELEAEVKKRTEEFERKQAGIEAGFRSKFDRFQEAAQRNEWGADWDAEGVWTEENPSDLGRPPRYIRIATTPSNRLLGAPDRVVAPFSLLDGNHLCVRASEADRRDALKLIHSVLFRTIASMPLGRVRYRVFDPMGIGSSVEQFSDFAALDGRVAVGQPLSDQKELAEALDELAEQASKVSSQYLKGKYQSLAKFLEEYPGSDTYEVLVLLDFPKAVGSMLPQKINSLAYEGAARGISLVVHQDLDEEQPKGFEFGKQFKTVEKGPSGWVLKDVLDSDLPLELDDSPPSNVIDRVAARDIMGPAEIGFDLVVGSDRWGASSEDGVFTPIGRFGLEKQEIGLGDDPVHALIGGGSGMGKSNLLRCIIYGLANRYSPKEVNFFLLDFKEGIEFAEFAKTENDPDWLPHARVVSVNSDRVFGAAVLEYLAAETRSRGDAIKKSNAKKFSEIKAKDPHTDFPRIVLIADEFHVLFSQSDQYTERAIGALKTLAKQGRAAGIHVVLASQTVSDLTKGGVGAWDAIFQQFALRIGLKTTPPESQAILGARNQAAASLKGRGFAVVNKKLGQLEENQETVIARVDDDLASDVRSEMLEEAESIGIAAKPPRIFDGSEAADCAPVLAELEGADRQDALSTVKVSLGSQPTINPADPSLDVPIMAAFAPDQDRHFSVLGSGTKEACSAITWAVLGLAASLKPGTARFSFIDFLREDDLPDAPEGMTTNLLEAVNGLGHEGQLIEHDEIGTFLTGLPKELETTSPDEGRHFIVLVGFDRVPSQIMTKPVYKAKETPLEHLRKLVEDGGVHGRHVIGWWSNYDGFAEQFKTSRLRNRFGMAGLLNLTAQSLREAGIKFDFTWDAPPNRMLWRDSSGAADPLVFLPYRQPTKSELEQLLAERAKA